jgi:hypothetical protein
MLNAERRTLNAMAEDGPTLISSVGIAVAWLDLLDDILIPPYAKIRRRTEVVETLVVLFKTIRSMNSIPGLMCHDTWTGVSSRDAAMPL